MKKESKMLLSVMILSIILMTVLYTGLLRDRQALKELNIQLTESRTAWENTAEEKEKLQEELKTAEEALKEAELTLKESIERAETLKKEIDLLQIEIDEAEPKEMEPNKGNTEDQS